MKLRIGYLKERKLLEDVENWTVQELENEARNKFVIDRNVSIGIYLGGQRINSAKSDKITKIGVVSGDLLMIKVGADGEENSQVSISSNNEEKMEISEPSTSSNIELAQIQVKNDVQLIELEKFVDLLCGSVQGLGFQKSEEHLLMEPNAETKVFYFKSSLINTQIRCACVLFFNITGVHNIQLNVSLINGDKFSHFDRLDIDSQTKLADVEKFMQDLKTEIFGPDNSMLKTMFCGDQNLTLKLFELCGLENVIALRKTCKIAYKKSNSCFLDQHYWKGELVRAFGRDQLPNTNDQDPTPCRKALFKKMREQDKAVFFNNILQRGRQETAIYERPHNDDYDPLAMPPRNPYLRHRELDPLQFDPLQNFNENFYGQEVYRPRPRNPYVPNAPIIYPHNHDDPLRNPRQPHNPDMPRGPAFGMGRRNPDRFI